MSVMPYFAAATLAPENEGAVLMQTSSNAISDVFGAEF
jgi:hypothetical protein